VCHGVRPNAHGGCGENVELNRLAHHAAGWKEWGVRVEGLMAHGVGVDQEQTWTKDPWWKEAARDRALLCIEATEHHEGNTRSG
jgi:hypothetical protein